MTQTAWVLSLSQFYLSLGFGLFFLALELGLAWILFGFRLFAGRSQAALLAYRFWVRVFALSLILGFAASLPLLLQLGTLWPGFMDRAGEVAGPLVGMAVLTAFIFKSCFLGAMLYGQRSLSDRMHALIVGAVAVGTSLTVWWIMVLLAWLQWPVGAVLNEGRYQVAHWLDMLGGIAPVLFGVMLVGGLLLVATLMLAVTALRTRDRPSDAGDRIVYAWGLRLVLLSLIVQALLVAVLGRQLLPLQPARVAAVVPQWNSGPPERPSLELWPADARGGEAWRSTQLSDWPDWAGLPAAGPLRGLNDLKGMHPPLLITYLSARLAVVLTGVLALLAGRAWWRGRRLGYEPDNLSRAGRIGLRALAWLAVLLQVTGWGHLLVGNLPYAIQGTVSLREIGTDTGEAALAAVLGLQLVVYGALATGFYQLLRHTTRFGVVPVARRRGRA
ncbi:MAG: cytochrome ubiquinol oxidase subunit I [Castellaniella sp.]|uniref:cytochrome ubiquinol oxidase subunit I n=1 Tax=Castellaniella sp. TaxID=1955812 RepID=UPI003A8C3CAC